MKKYITLVSSVVFFVFIFSYQISHASNCVAPTPPTCYNTVNVPIYTDQGSGYSGPAINSATGEGVMPDSRGAYGYTIKQVQVSCSGTQKEIDYEVQQLDYNTCQQINSINSNSENNKTNTQSPETPTLNNQAMRDENCNDNFATGSIYNKSTGHCTCKSGYTPYDSNYQSPDYYDSIRVTSINDIQLACIPEQAKQASLDAIRKQGNIDAQKVHPGATPISTPTKPAPTTNTTTQNSCPLNSTFDPKNNNCPCNKGYGNDGVSAGCVPRVQAMSTICASLYGSKTHYNTSTDQCECSSGYVFENSTNGVADEKNNKCISLADWNKKNGTNYQTSQDDISVVQPTPNVEITNSTTSTNPEPVKQVPWYKKIFSWIFK